VEGGDDRDREVDESAEKASPIVDDPSRAALSSCRAMMWSKSPPAEKTLPVEARTIARTSPWWRTSFSASMKPSCRAGSKRFSTSGRVSVISASNPS
jgi:hypothetical protein